MTFKRNDGTVTKTVELRYDLFNQLTQRVVDPDGAMGAAALQTDDYLWDEGELLGVYGYSNLVFSYGPAPDMVLFESDAFSLHTLLGDHQHTVRDVIDSARGTLENHLVYNSYGELKSQTGGGAYSPFHRFTGKPFDTAVGLQYNLNRWYDAATGRWMSEDPIGFGGGDYSISRYVGNSPTNRVDPDGLFGLDMEGNVYRPRSVGQDGSEPSFWSVWWEYILPWNNPPAVDGWDTVLAGGKPIAAGTAVVAGGAAAIATYGTTTVVATVGQEVAEEVFEQTTGIPVIVDPVDLIQSGVKQTVKHADEFAFALPTGDTYSVIFKMDLSPTSYPGRSRGSHFQEANEKLLQMMEADPRFAQVIQSAGVNLGRTQTGLAPRTSPAGWTWHHGQQPGVMELVPRPQHTPGSPFWDSLHPSGLGGYSIWGKP